MRDLLLLSHRIPYPPDKGEKIRCWNVIQHLAKSYRIHLGCLVDDPADWLHLAHLRGVCADVAAFGMNKRRQKIKAVTGVRPGQPLMLDYYRHAGLQSWVTQTMARRDIDIAYIYTAAMAPYVMGFEGIGLILDMTDIDSEKWSQYARQSRGPMRLVWAREGRTLLAFERRAAQAFDDTFFVSEQECRRFVELAPEAAGRVHAIENGVDLQYFSPDLRFESPFAAQSRNLVFTGTMDYWPNADAVIWFTREVMPILRKRAPSPHFHIVGANPGPEVLRLAADPDVHVTGRVPDVRPYVVRADVSVAPLRIARGIQNKVLEAMALGRPVVATPQAFEGVRAEPGQDLLVADGAAEMARCIEDVIDGHHPSLGAKARFAMERGYAWSATLAHIDPFLERAQAAHRTAARVTA